MVHQHQKMKSKSIYILLFLLSLWFTACNPGVISPSDTKDQSQTEDDSQEENSQTDDQSETEDPIPDDNPSSDYVPALITDFTLEGACGYSGSSSISVTAITEGDYSGWQIVNSNWHSAPIFSFSTGDADLSQYVGITCRIQLISSDLNWKDVFLELNDSNNFGIIDSDNSNIMVAKNNTGSLSQNTEKIFYFDFADLPADTVRTGARKFALGISAGQDSTYKIYDIQLIPPDADAVKWTEADSLKDAWEPLLGYFGLAVEYSELQRASVQSGLSKNAGGITMGNALKPDYILGNEEPSTTSSFTAQDGMDYVVPSALQTGNLDDILEICADNNLQMRGHVLVWHSQSPTWFFRSGFSASGNYVDAATMNARMEWYIKTLLSHVADWESNNNSGEHIITTWDVVNEAVSDSANGNNWLRGSNGEDSDWYEVYGNGDFIINAFKYANRYAPTDVLLAYNDYNSYISGKTAGIIKLIESVQAAAGTRLDVMGMQSHVNMTYPGVSAHETAVEAFLAKGVDVEITELDIHNTDNSTSGQTSLAALYGDYFRMFKSHKKTTGKGIRGITIWGLRDTTTWLTSLNGETSYPLLLDGWFYTKPAWDSVIEAASN